MSAPVELVPLRCLRCSAPVPAEPDQVAWACTQCGQGLLLDEAQGLVPLEIHYAIGLRPETKGRPFWVVEGRVHLARGTYSNMLGNKTGEAERFWGQPRRFYIPAFTCPLDELLEAGAQLVQAQPALQPGQPASFEPVTLDPADLAALTEFIVLNVEAGRKDQLKNVEVSVRLGKPELWILP